MSTWYFLHEPVAKHVLQQLMTYVVGLCCWTVLLDCVVAVWCSFTFTIKTQKLHTCHVSRFRRESHNFGNEIRVSDSRWLLYFSLISIECLTFICDLFTLFTSLKQFIHLKWLLNILKHVSRSYLVISSQIKHWFFLYFENSDRHIFPQKKYRTRSERLRLILRSFLTLASLDVTF